VNEACAITDSEIEKFAAANSSFVNGECFPCPKSLRFQKERFAAANCIFRSAQSLNRTQIGAEGLDPLTIFSTRQARPVRAGSEVCRGNASAEPYGSVDDSQQKTHRLPRQAPSRYAKHGHELIKTQIRKQRFAAANSSINGAQAAPSTARNRSVQINGLPRQTLPSGAHIDWLTNPTPSQKFV